MSPTIIVNIFALRPGHYTRPGTAIRHATTILAEQNAERKLMNVLADGNPNDLDQYEGLLLNPARLTRALPDIFRTLTRET